MLLKNKELDPMDATFFSYNLLLPDSVGSVRRLEAIYENIEQADTHAMVLKNFEFRSPRDTDIESYVALNPISSSNDSIMVYRAARILTTIHETDRYRDSHTIVSKSFCGLKVVDNPESILKLKEEIRRTLAVHGLHQNLLTIGTSFMDEQSKKFCAAVTPLAHSSIRTVMKNGFPQGFPEDLILSALRSVLNALSFLHRQHILHRDINAARIYLCCPAEPMYSGPSTINFSEISLGFAAAAYEDEMGNTVASHSSFLPMASVSNWAAAPEVYNGNQPYSEKADIWLLGITALELAYGELRVTNRDVLETMIKDIVDKKKLPSKDYLNEKIIDEIMEKGEETGVAAEKDKMVKKLKYYVQKLVPYLSSSNDEDGPFSESFTKMVMECLAWDPKRRPSVDRLLSNQFFRRSLPRKDGKYFYDAVMNKTFGKKGRSSS